MKAPSYTSASCCSCLLLDPHLGGWVYSEPEQSPALLSPNPGLQITASYKPFNWFYFARLIFPVKQPATELRSCLTASSPRRTSGLRAVLENHLAYGS